MVTLVRQPARRPFPRHPQGLTLKESMRTAPASMRGRRVKRLCDTFPRSPGCHDGTWVSGHCGRPREEVGSGLLALPTPHLPQRPIPGLWNTVMMLSFVLSKTYFLTIKDGENEWDTPSWNGAGAFVLLPAHLSLPPALLPPGRILPQLSRCQEASRAACHMCGHNHVLL